MPISNADVIQQFSDALGLSGEERNYFFRLLNSDDPVDTLPNKTKKLLSMAFGYLAQALNTTGNTFLFKSRDQEAIASLTTAFQSCFRNVFSGALIAGGKMTSGALETQSDDTVREIITTSYVLAVLSTLVSMTCYGAGYFVLPHVFKKETAHDAMPYLFFTGILGTWPILGLVVIQQIAYAKNYCTSQVMSTLMSRIPSILIGYGLMKYNDRWSASTNIGIGNLIAPLISYFCMEWWMRRQTDLREIMQLPLMQASTSVNEAGDEIRDALITTPSRLTRVQSSVKKHFPAMFRLFLEMLFQRATEWVNLLIITFILGAIRNSYLSTITASLQIMSIFNLCSQGIGAGATMDAERVKKEFERTLGWIEKLNDTPESPERNQVIQQLLIHSEFQYSSLKSIVIKAQLLGLGINSVVATSLCVLRKPIVSLFSQASSTDAEKTMAEWVLMITAASLLFDASRLISCSSLVPWKKNMLTNMISLVTMTVIGIPVSYAATKGKSDETILYWTFIIRTFMIFVAAMMNLYVQFREFKKDYGRIEFFKNKLFSQEPSNRPELSAA